MTCCFHRSPVVLLIELAQALLFFLVVLLRLCVQLVQAAPVPLRRALAVGTTTFSMLVSCAPSGLLEIALPLYPGVVFACIAAELSLLDASDPRLPIAIARGRA